MGLAIFGNGENVMFNRKKEYAMLNQMLDAAISGEFDETIYDESELSKLQTKLKQYLSVSAMSEKKINSEKNNLKELITNISHQIKTPLTNILLYAQLLEEQSEHEIWKEYAEEIMIHTKKLDVLIQALTKISRLETGIFQFEQKQERLNNIVDSIIDMGKSKISEKNISISVNGETDAKAVIDKRWTTEAVYNILDNAIKYSDSNSSINISIFQYELFSGIRIKDEGMGLSEDEIPKIFGRFYRGKSVHDKDGIGVGLFLAREIVENQGGYIKVISNFGEGSTFEVYLPKNNDTCSKPYFLRPLRH
jgi:signal transduction histidine kinase